jgi:hypothetical protein
MAQQPEAEVRTREDRTETKARDQVARYAIEKMAVLGENGKKLAEGLGVKTIECYESHAAIIEAVTDHGAAGLLPTHRLDNNEPIPHDGDEHLTTAGAWVKTGKIAAIASVKDTESEPPIRASILILNSQGPAVN